MASKSVNCSKGTNQTVCTDIIGCAWDTSNSPSCVCAAGYGGTDASACTKCEGTQFKQAVGNAACDTCNTSYGADGVIGIPAGATSDDGNTICGCAAGYAGKNVTSNTTAVSCTICKDDQYTGEAGTAACASCGPDKVGVPNNGSLDASSAGPNVKCFCKEATQGLLGAGCVQCNGEGQSIADGACTCTEGYTQDQQTGTCTKGGSTTTVDCSALTTETACNGDKSCAWDASGNACKCKDSAANTDPAKCPIVSSASPLAVALICVLILSIVASVAAVATVIRRKAAVSRTSKASVSETL